MSIQSSRPSFVSRRTRSPRVGSPPIVRRMRSADVSRSSSGTIASGIGRPMTSSAVQPKIRSEARFHTVTVRSMANACVASGDESTIADSISLARASSRSASRRATSSSSATASATRRRFVDRQSRASANATSPAKQAIVTGVAVSVNRTRAGPIRIASAAPAVPTIAAAMEAWRSRRRCRTPSMTAMLIIGRTTATAIPAGSMAAAARASMFRRTAPASRNERRRRPMPSVTSASDGSRTPAIAKPGLEPGTSASPMAAPTMAMTGAPTRISRSHALSSGRHGSGSVRRCEGMAGLSGSTNRFPVEQARLRPSPTGGAPGQPTGYRLRNSTSSI